MYFFKEILPSAVVNTWTEHSRLNSVKNESDLSYTD